MRAGAYLLICFIFLVALQNVAAQNFGGNPSSTRWRQVKNDAAKVIYPRGLDSVANRIASVSQWMLQQQDGTIGKTHRRINIVLQPEVNFSNAYVGLGPYRSEFYLMPPQNPFELGSISWADNLAVHEFRHAQQFSNYNKGLSKFMRIVAGENGQALANSMAVPNWFFEGDAVWGETVHTAQGRGRLPSFFSGYRGLDMAGKKYAYQKLRNGSLRHYVPSHYDLGYLLVSYGRETYGDSIWQKVTEDAAAYRKLFYPLQGALAGRTGTAFKPFVSAALDDFRTKAKQTSLQEPKWLTQISDKYVVDYKYPYPTADGAIICLQRGYRQIPRFVKVDEQGNSTSIAVRDIGYDDYFSYRNGRIVYAALKPDKRWGNRDFSILRLLDVESQSVHTITKSGRYFSPDINESGDKIVAVSVNEAGRSQLVLMNTEGAVAKSFASSDGLFFSHPRFADEAGERVVFATRNAEGKMGWMIWETASAKTSWLLPPSSRLLGFPVVQGDTLVYTATEGGVDAAYAQLFSTGQRFQLAAYPTGIYQAFLKNGVLMGSFFTVWGYRLGQAPGAMRPMLAESAGLVPLYQFTTSGEKQIGGIASTSLTSSTYSKGRGFFNIHSWQPEASESEYGFRVYGNNVLNTTSTQLYYAYNTNERSHAAGATFMYGGWYVQPLADVKQTWGREVVYNADTTFIYNETRLAGGLQLPLNLTSGRHYRSLLLSATLNSNALRWTGLAESLLRNDDFLFVRTRLTYTSQIQRARQHIFPRFAQTFLADYQTMVDNHKAWQVLLSGALYLPGVHVNHNLVLTAAYQRRDTMQQYIYSNNFSFSRGYNAINFPQLWKLGANYHLPLFYPDWGFGHIVYFLRFRANAFYDYTQGKSLRTGLTYPFSTAGLEIFADTRWWNQLPATIGLRYSRLLDEQLTSATRPNQWEVILPINIL